MLENFQGDSWGSIPPLRMPSLLPHDLCHGRSSSGWLLAVIDFQLSYSRSWKIMLWKCCTQYAICREMAPGNSPAVEYQESCHWSAGSPCWPGAVLSALGSLQKLVLPWRCISWQLPSLASLGQAHMQCHGKTASPEGYPQHWGWRSSFSFVFGLIYAQLTSNYWSGWTASSTLDAEKIALHDLLHHPHNKPHSKPFMLCMVFFLLYWTLIILLEIISPILINDFSKSAGTILFGTESLKFYIFYVLSYTLILKCDWINLKNISLFLKC